MALLNKTNNIMKALSVKQPWASIIVNGLKDTENRTWQTKHRGWVLIHASAKSDKYSFTMPQTTALNAMAFKNSTDRGCIIGAIYIDSIDKEIKSIWDDPGCYHWRISKVIKFKEPIRNIKGKLNLWNYDLPQEYKQLL